MPVRLAHPSIFLGELAMKNLVILLAAIAVAATSANASITCRKPNGQFAKASECPGKAAAAADVATNANTKKDKTGRCHWTTSAGKHKAGQLVKCP